MGKYILMAYIAMLLVGILGCKENRAIVREEGLDQEFMVRNVTQVYQDDQTLFFHVEETARWLGQQKIKFFWGRMPTDFNLMAVDMGRINFVIDEKKEIPTVMFVFHDSWLNQYVEDSTKERRSARILIESPSIPNIAVYGVKIRLSRQQYIDLMVSLLSKKQEE